MQLDLVIMKLSLAIAQMNLFKVLKNLIEVPNAIRLILERNLVIEQCYLVNTYFC